MYIGGLHNSNMIFEVVFWDHCDKHVVNWTEENKSIKGGNGQSSLDTHSRTQMQVC